MCKVGKFKVRKREREKERERIERQKVKKVSSPPVVGERDRVSEQLRPVRGQREAFDGLVLDDLDDLRDGADARAQKHAVALEFENFEFQKKKHLSRKRSRVSLCFLSSVVSRWRFHEKKTRKIK